MRKRTLFLLLIVILAIAGWLYWRSLMKRGFSARENPSGLEAFIARRMRLMAIPAGAREKKNPVAATPETMQAAMEHWADHCATCHANDGSGNTTIGQNVYPKAPDMRQEATQKLTDGELFYVIGNGIRLSAMPAWGGGEHEDLSWQLVHFIRRLPKLTPQEIERMKQWNPASREELEREGEAEKFLQGAAPAKPASKPHNDDHKH